MSMQWSKQKQQVEKFFAPALAGRVRLHVAAYRHAHDQMGRGYISVDGVEVWNMCTFRFLRQEAEAIAAELESDGRLNARQAQIQVTDTLDAAGCLSQAGFHVTLRDYCNNSIEANLASSNALRRALAMLDMRLGKRRLAVYDSRVEHPMVRYFHQLRCQAEGMALQEESCS